MLRGYTAYAIKNVLTFFFKINVIDGDGDGNDNSLRGGMKKLDQQMAKLIQEELQSLRITSEVLMESETIVRKIISGIVQPE